jgi:hypothetical protein
MMRISHHITFIILSLICTSPFLYGSDQSMEKVMPPVCVEGWTMDGKVTFFDKDTLFDRIDGESELFFPYGFEMLAYARYQNRQDPKIAIDADVYKMGSLLDAFGMFANYRRRDDADAPVGGGGTVSSSQMFFYQDRYFVRLQITGTTSAKQNVFLTCAKAISKNLPQNADRPSELEAFMIPAVVKKSERYVAQSLLGYDFFRQGLIAEAFVNGEQLQVFVVPEQTRETARKTFDEYCSYLKQSKSDTLITREQGRPSLEALDPLYGKVYVEQAGRFVIGAIRVKDGAAAKQLVEQVRKRIGEKEK